MTGLCLFAVCSVRFISKSSHFHDQFVEQQSWSEPSAFQPEPGVQTLPLNNVCSTTANSCPGPLPLSIVPPSYNLVQVSCNKYLYAICSFLHSRLCSSPTARPLCPEQRSKTPRTRVNHRGHPKAPTSTHPNRLGTEDDLSDQIAT